MKPTKKTKSKKKRSTPMSAAILAEILERLCQIEMRLTSMEMRSVPNYNIEPRRIPSPPGGAVIC